MLFTQNKGPDLMTGKTRVVFQADHVSSPGGFNMVATEEGLILSGDTLTVRTEKELQEFAKAVSDAWTQHKKLKPRLALNAAGH